MRARYLDVTLSSNRAIRLPDRRTLDGLYGSGGLPWTIAGVLDVRDAIGLCRALPDVSGSGSGLPKGYGILPPRNAEPVIRIRRAGQAASGGRIPAGARGVVGAMWSEGGHPVIRLWFRSSSAGTVRGPLDIRENMIAAIGGLEGVVPQLTGWQLERLDRDTPPQLVGV